MKNTMKKITAGLSTIFMSGLATIAPVMATDCGEGKVPTSIIGNDGSGCADATAGGIMNILNLVVEIMTIGIGILAVIGITVTGIQYMTASGNEEQVRKSKRRILEIVIGLAAYVLIYAGLVFLLPDFHPFN